LALTKTNLHNKFSLIINTLIDPDDIRDDGIYSAYILPQCLGAGRINVKIFAKGQEGKVRIKSVTAGGQAPYQGLSNHYINLYHMLLFVLSYLT
jgi:hypothetical protein